MMKILECQVLKKTSIIISKQLLSSKGRILVRPSGTEPKIRIMCESKDETLLKKCTRIVSNSLR